MKAKIRSYISEGSTWQIFCQLTEVWPWTSIYITPATSDILSCVPSTTYLLVTIIGASIYHNYIFSCFLCLFVLFSLAVFSSDKALWPVPEKCTGSDALWRFAPCNSKSIPHFNSTNYLALNVRSFSTRIKCQTFSVAMVERNSHFSVSAPWLLEAFCGELEAREQCLAIGITSQEPVNAKKAVSSKQETSPTNCCSNDVLPECRNLYFS